MDNYVITIARGFGSGGKHIGQELSLRLGIPCYESQILSMASTYSGLSEGLFNKVDERLKNLNILQRLFRTPSLDFIVQPADKKFTGDLNLFNIQTKIIKELCKKQSCIIIGKCANWLLKDEENVASFYVEAPRKNCLESITNLLGVDEKEAAKLITRTDRYRADYYKYYTGGHDWTDPVAYDMTLNTARVGRDSAVDVIIDYVKRKFGDDILNKRGMSDLDEILGEVEIIKSWE